MGFRGVLLRIAEGDEEAGGAFHVVAPDAELALPSEQQRSPHGGNALSARADQVLVVTDHVSARLLQVAGCAGVLLQRETHSALWVAALASQKAATLVEDAASQQQQPALASRTAPLQQLSLNVWSHSHSNGGASGSQSRVPAGRSCYCFQFRSGVEFDMFERTLQAYLRVQRMALLENSVLLEMEIEKEIALKLAASKTKALSSLGGANDAICSKRGNRSGGGGTPGRAKNQQARSMTRDELRAAAKQQRQQTSRTQGSAIAMSRSIQQSCAMSGGSHAGDAKAQRVVTNGSAAGTKGGAAAASRTRARPQSATTPREVVDPNVRCILCGNSQAQTSKPLSKHPFVLQDARGEDCYVCQVCMQQLLKRRVQNQAFPTPGDVPIETVCALCAEPASTFTHALKKCVHPQCPRLYCTACLHKLVGKTKTHKVWRAKLWYCPCCTNYDAANSTEEETPSQDTSTEPATTAAAGSKGNEADEQAKKKRKRRVDPVANEQNSAIKQATKQATVAEEGAAPELEPVDYAANYFQFLTQRELAKSAQDESEDVCFCCKDGGELVECDWPGDEHDYARCPKVYHEDCLGYKVPEDFVWKCPRHRCQACGIIAMFSCRFCVTSFCSEHVPEEITKLGPGSRDIPDSTYVICKTCEHNSQRALSEGKLSSKIHTLLHRVAGKQHAGSK